MISVEVRGMEEAQAAMRRAVASVKPGNGIDAAVRFATVEAQARAIGRTHVITGSLRASHMVEVTGNRGRVFISTSTINPVTKQPPSRYGPFEHARGGDHAFYANTVAQDGPQIVREAMDVFRRWLP